MKFLMNVLLILCVSGYLQTAEAKQKLIKVVVIDTGLRAINISQANLCDGEHLDLTGEGIDDKIGHGTNVTGLIVGNAGDPAKYCIVMVKAYSINTDKNVPLKEMYVSFLPEAINYAAQIGADVVNISGGGYGANFKESMAVKNLLKNGTILVVAAGNDGTDLNKLCDFFPACYDQRIIVVGANEKFSNFGKVVDIKVSGKDRKAFGITMSGTSQSTAIVTGRIIKNLAINKKVR